MSTDPSSTAMGRIDAAVEESSRRSAVPPDELADLATALQRIESLIAEGAAQEPNGSAAVEPIGGIAFTLHEREVESSLGDELNAAVREINDIGGLKQLSPERAQQAAELLRQLSRRVHDMIAQSKVDQSKVDQRPGPAWKKTQFVVADEDDEEHDLLNDGSFKTDVPEDDEFALVVAALTAALPSLPEFGAPVPVPPAALAQGAAPLGDDALLPELSIEPGDEAKTAESEPASPPAETSSGETVIVVESQSSALLDEPILPSTLSNKEESSREESSAGELPAGALSDTLLEDLLRDAVQGIDPSKEEPPEAVVEVPPVSEALAEDSAKALLALPPPEAPAHKASAAKLSETQSPREAEEERAADAVAAVSAESALPPSDDPSLLPPVTPDDDPGDLFDLTPPAQSNVASMFQPAAPSERAPEPAEATPAPLAASLPDASPQIPSSPPSQQSRGPTAPAQPQPVPRPAANDPLGPVRALSEEETIALFS